MLIAVAVGATGLATWVNTVPILRATFELIGMAILIAFGIAVLLKAVRLRVAAGEARPDHLVRWAFIAVITNPKALGLFVVVLPTVAHPGLHGIHDHLFLVVQPSLKSVAGELVLPVLVVVVVGLVAWLDQRDRDRRA